MTSTEDRPPQQYLGKRIRQLRERQRLSQEDLAAASHLHRTYVGSVERGERNVALRNIQAIANALGIPLSDLFQGL